METKIQACDCKHPYQDRMYGQGLRVHNVGAAGKSITPKKVCTVCGKVK